MRDGMWVVGMFLGLLLAGMVLGAGAATAWVLTGGSLLLGLAIYSLVATLFILGAAVIAFCLSERKSGAASVPAEALRPAE